MDKFKRIISKEENAVGAEISAIIDHAAASNDISICSLRLKKGGFAENAQRRQLLEKALVICSFSDLTNLIYDYAKSGVSFLEIATWLVDFSAEGHRRTGIRDCISAITHVFKIPSVEDLDSFKSKEYFDDTVLPSHIMGLVSPEMESRLQDQRLKHYSGFKSEEVIAFWKIKDQIGESE